MAATDEEAIAFDVVKVESEVKRMISVCSLTTGGLSLKIGVAIGHLIE